MLEHDHLLSLIQNRDIDGARALFDRAFWQKTNTTPTWEHLKLAITAQDAPMIKLLVTWGATPTKMEWETSSKHFSAQQKKYLRRAGLDLNNLPDISPQTHAQPIIPKSFYIPNEWVKVLRSFKSVSDSKPCIAGGALRDLFNERSVHDVDIFLFTQGSQSKNKKLIQKAFKKADIAFTMDNIRSGQFTRKITLQKRHTIRAVLRTESWDITAGKNKTKYNVIFLEKHISLKNIHAKINVSPQPSDAFIIPFFDFNLCKIAYDGDRIIAHKGYKQDVDNKTITWDAACETSQAHLDKIIKKYPEFKIDPAVIHDLKLKSMVQKAANKHSPYRNNPTYRSGY